MAESSTLAARVQETLTSFLDAEAEKLREIGPDVEPLIEEARSFLSGGKRLRAQFLAAAYQATLFDPMPGELPQHLVEAAAALELFHAAALIHDDVIDHSDTRRGRPAVHRRFETLHKEQSWRSHPEDFGIASAILIGDLLQSWADQLFNQALAALPSAHAERARNFFNRMRSEVAVGQYLDVLEEQQGALMPEAEQLERATRVLVYKSAKYSVESPLLIGTALGGGSAQQEEVVRDYGLPVGVAFQLRDDLLGVFGDAEVTGKPAGDDLREGKRTVLVGLTRQHLPTSARHVFDELLGDPSLTAEQIDMMQRTILDSGAVDAVESMIAGNVERAREALDRLTADPSHAAVLRALAERATQRNA